MKVTDVKLHILKEGRTKAIGSITLDGAFVVSGITLREGTNGLFVAMPGRKGANDKYYDVAFPLNVDLRTDINVSVKKAYESMIGKEKVQEEDGLPEGFIRVSSDDYLKNAEMDIEDDFDMIDGIINNGSKEDMDTPLKDRLLSDAREQAGKQKPAKKNIKEKEAEIYA